MPIDAPGRVFGLPTWAVVVTLGAAGVVGYLIFFRNAGGGGGGQQASTFSSQGLAVMQNPDESATMAEQNRLLSELGFNMQTGFDTLNANVGQVGDNVNSGFSSVGTSLNGISGQVGDVSNQVGGVATQNGQMAAANQAYYQQLAAAMSAMGSSLSSSQNASQQQAAAYYNGLSQQLTNMLNGQSVWDQTLAQKIDYVAAIGNTYLPNIYQRTVMQSR